MQASNAGALRIDGVAGGLGPAAAIHVEVTPAGDRLSFDNDCKVWMQRVGPWPIISDDDQCDGDGVTFGGASRSAL